MQLIIATPKGSTEPTECDSVHIAVRDNAKGKDGGCYGIRKGHAKSLFALSKGELSAFLNGEKIFSAVTGEGFATVDNDVITVVTAEISE